MIRNIVFDIGNVLAAFDWEGHMNRLGISGAEFDIIANAVFRSSDWSEMDRGVLTPEEVIQRFCSKAPQYAEDIKKAVYSYSGMIRQYPYTKPLLRQLKEHGCKVYYLSNYGKFAVEATKDALDFTKMMDGGLYSYEVQMVKPNRWIFAELMQRYRLKPEETVFFDDNPANVQAASGMGMKGILFLGYEDAVNRLEEFGIILDRTNH